MSGGVEEDSAQLQVVPIRADSRATDFANASRIDSLRQRPPGLPPGADPRIVELVTLVAKLSEGTTDAIKRLNAAVAQLQETTTQNRSRIVELEKIINN